MWACMGMGGKEGAGFKIEVGWEGRRGGVGICANLGEGGGKEVSRGRWAAHQAFHNTQNSMKIHTYM